LAGGRRQFARARDVLTRKGRWQRGQPASNHQLPSCPRVEQRERKHQHRSWIKQRLI
jgi:hypothetical protein